MFESEIVADFGLTAKSEKQGVYTKMRQKVLYGI